MDSLSYVCTLMKPSIFLRGSQRTFAIGFIALSQIFVRILRPRSYGVKPKLDDDGKCKIQPGQADLKVLHLDNSPKGSTFERTSYMRWRTIHPRLDCMVPQICIQLNLYVSHICNVHITQSSFSGVQGELEHRTSKVRFARTSHKAYVSQLASIEWWQAHIRMRRETFRLADPVPNKADDHHVIGQSQSFPEDVTSFMQTNIGDPTVKVSLTETL